MTSSGVCGEEKRMHKKNRRKGRCECRAELAASAPFLVYTVESFPMCNPLVPTNFEKVLGKAKVKPIDLKLTATVPCVFAREQVDAGRL